jgi:hypothetical protein
MAQPTSLTDVSPTPMATAMCLGEQRSYKYSFVSQYEPRSNGRSSLYSALGGPEFAARAVQRRLSFGLRISSKA